MILYTRHQCSACESVKAHLKEKGFEFTEVNIMEDYQAAMRLVESGVRTVPTLEDEVSGDRFIGADAIKTRVA